nr:immunoglobulin heavy chain junction region [Mus musculus]
CLRGYYFDYW